MNEHVHMYTGTSILVNRLAFLLEEALIPSIVKNEVESGRLAGFGTTGDAVALYVFQSDVEKAMPVIENFKEEISA